MSPGYRALHESAAWLDQSGRGRIRATGEDRLRLIHALASNSVETLASGQGTAAFFLNPQGRIQVQARIYVAEDHVLLECDAARRRTLSDYLESYIIMDDVTLEDKTDSWAAVAVEGPRAEAILGAAGVRLPPAARHAHSETDGVRVFRSSLSAAEGFWISLPRDRKEPFVAALGAAGAAAADPEDFRVVRVENRVPVLGEDFTDANIPHETGLLDAVSFTKGCYVGQEIVERVETQGTVNRVLAPIELEGAEMPADLGVEWESAKVGRMTSPVYSPREKRVLGFALLRRAAAGAGTPLQVGGIPARVREQSAG